MRVHLLMMLASVLIVACGDPGAVSAGASDPEVTPPATSDVAASAAAATVSVGSSDLGDILVDGDGRTLYLLTGDEQSASTCYEDCAENWPPLAGPAEAGDGADVSLLGDIERDDGTVQATYNNWPLYYFAGDAEAGDVKGQGVGGVWFVVDASGEPVKEGGGDEETTDY